jgi:hypothetical protein
MGLELTSSPPCRLFRAFRPHHQLSPWKMGWISLRILLCPSPSVQPAIERTPLLQPSDQAIAREEGRCDG